MGEELPPDLGEEWGPQHPCFPHLNPHVPLDSPEYHNTRIIRVRRDWLIEGDLAPTFSNLYPEILDPAGLSEQEFRRIIDKLNSELIPIFSPYNWRNVVDGLLGLVTGWLWDDLGFTGVKARLKRLERWIDQWNVEMEKTVGNEDSSMAPRIISLRKTGYMTVSIRSPSSAFSFWFGALNLVIARHPNPRSRNRPGPQHTWGLEVRKHANGAAGCRDGLIFVGKPWLIFLCILSFQFVFHPTLFLIPVSTAVWDEPT